MNRKTTLQAFPEITSEQWERLRQSFIVHGIQVKKRDLERKLAVGYFSEAFYPVPDEVGRDSYFLTSQIQRECEDRAAVKINEFWNAMFEIFGIERMTKEGKWLTNATLATVDAKRGKNCGGMSPETFWSSYVNFQDTLARVTETGEYDPETIAANLEEEDDEENG